MLQTIFYTPIEGEKIKGDRWYGGKFYRRLTRTDGLYPISDGAELYMEHPNTGAVINYVTVGFKDEMINNGITRHMTIHPRIALKQKPTLT
jgi:hypothetical protein